MYVTAMTVCLFPRRTGGAFLSSFQRRKNVSACFQEELHINLNNAAELRETGRAYCCTPPPRALFAILELHRRMKSRSDAQNVIFCSATFSLKVFETVRGLELNIVKCDALKKIIIHFYYYYQ